MKPLHRSLLATIVAVVGLNAHAETEPVQSMTVDIDAQPLGEALNQLSSQTGLQIILHSRLARGLRSVRLVGEFTPQAALERLLADTGLRYEYLGPQAVAVVGPDDRARETGMKVSGSEGGDVAAVRVAQADAVGKSSEQESASTEEDKTADQLEEIVVTAQKREQRLQDVPISLSVLSGRDLDRSTAQGVNEALSRVPGVAIRESTAGGNSMVTVRGVAAAGPQFFGSNPVAFYLDSVPFALVKSAIVPDASPYDLERVEVLRGPQGTLHGVAALNGVVRVLTHDVNLTEFELKGRTSASSVDDGSASYRADAAINVPLIEGKFGARAVVGYEDFGGWIDKPNDEDANDSEAATFRLKMAAQPTDHFSAGVSAWISRADFGAPSHALESATRNSTVSEPLTTDYDIFNFDLAYEFSSVTLKSMTSHIDYDNHIFMDYNPGAPPPSFLGGFLIESVLTSKVFTQEIYLNSTQGDSWRWTAGGMYRKGEDRLGQFYQAGPQEFVWADSSQSNAVFGELTRVLSEGRLELTGGLRYFEDEVKSYETPVPYNTRTKFDALTPRAIATWHVSGHTTVYGSYAEGYRSGFDQFSAAKNNLGLPPIQPDTLKNYELGLKGSSGDRRVSYEAAVYFMDWQDVQQSINVLLDDGRSGAANVNGDSASGIGVDLAVSANPVAGLELGVTLSWNDLTSDAQVRTGPQQVILFDKGERLNNSPEYTVGASADYIFPFGGRGFKGRFSASANYTSEQRLVGWPGFGNRDVTVGDTMLLARTSFSIEAPEHWTASLFVDNVNNEDGAAIRDPFADFATRPRPRTLGLQLQYRL
jgi:iron complex outermembrane recepter protein